MKFAPDLKAITVLSMISCGRAFVKSARRLSTACPTRHLSSTLQMAVSKKDAYDITLLTGDGIGPEIASATVDVLAVLGKKTGVTFNFKEALIGGAAIDATGNPFPDETLEQCKKSDSILLACIGGYKWDGNPRETRPETGLLKLRSSMGLFANLRPARCIPQLIDSSAIRPEVLEGVDIMVVRELTGDVYFGKPKGIDRDPETGERVGYNNMIYKESEIARIARVAFEVSKKRQRRVCSIDKANVLDVSQLWRDVVTEIGEADYPDVELSHMYVDNAAMQLIRWPKQFDTILCGNIFGDILSDEASMLVGSLGMLPSASLGDPALGGPGVFEPCHGSAPDIAGQDQANPCAMVLSAAMMCRYDLDREEEANMLVEAVNAVLEKGYRTADIMGAAGEADASLTLVGCAQMGKLIAEEL